jgi:hypothetical protein
MTTMTSEQLDLLRKGEAVLHKLSMAVDGAEPRPVLFALTSFVIATIKQTKTPLPDLIDALHKAQAIGDRYSDREHVRTSIAALDLLQEPKPIGNSVSVDGLVDDHGIRYMGLAHEMSDGTWRCLAVVGGSLCIVEVTVTQGVRDGVRP